MQVKVAYMIGILVLGGCKTLEGLKEDFSMLRGQKPTTSQGEIQASNENLLTQETSTDNKAKSTSQMGDAIVREVQAKLKVLGYDTGVPDGKFGAKTEAAIQDFQLDHDLAIDGKPSKSLLRMINAKL